MLGTFGGALEARQIDASHGRLTADVTGEVETEEGVLVIRRIHVTMRLKAPEQARESVERVHAYYPIALPPLQDTAPSNPAHFLVRVDTRSGLVFLGFVTLRAGFGKQLGEHPAANEGFTTQLRSL